MTRVMMSCCKSTIKGFFLYYGSLIFSFSLSAIEVLKKSRNTSKGDSKIATVINVFTQLSLNLYF